jgi:hypothetical protein
MESVNVEAFGAWGEFRIHGSAESDLVQRSCRLAELNPTKPGHHWFRVVVEVRGEDEPRRGIKLFHIDLAAMRLVVSESWNGAETARMTVPLPLTFG